MRILIYSKHRTTVVVFVTKMYSLTQERLVLITNLGQVT